ncbi:hypothetical protein [Hyunsoonleella pacifica]|uniref:DUF3575 domain-containing protein n=1 Tax=Hyunsoonleella pacifica TaxID=1080224 RepID=A0A4V6MT91_9FLAO|nr:hypothetical protein [Hyunsoonleella pacifica]TBN17798.1 hypothetical protein EYD46_05660 [Hyunsoonleella pacifica]GGD08885.1 hypothetical protein GCM10011368_08500 [Hyunsoonleella pacifica]
MKKYSVIFLLVYAIQLRAQTKAEVASFLDRTEFKIGYSGTILWSNGISLGAEYLWKDIKKTKDRRGAYRTNTHQFLFNGNLGFVTNFASKADTGGFTNFGITWRRTNKKGKQFSIDLNPLGYYRSFLPETYEVIGDKVDKVFLPGRGYYSPSLSVGIGKLRKGKVRSGRYLNVTYSPRFNYNTGTLPTFSIQYGFRFNFKNKKQ